MGLDTTHNAWHGPYSSFNNFRREVLRVYNGTDLFDYAGYEMRSRKDNNRISPQLPLANIADVGILLLIDHSDCDGDFSPIQCKLISESLMQIAPKVTNDYYRGRLIEFAEGCALAYNNGETLEFH